MDKLATYALVAAIGEITKPTREERAREGDRWVALRTLSNAPTTIEGEAPSPSAPPDAPAAHPRPIFFTAIDRRHREARRKAGL